MSQFEIERFGLDNIEKEPRERRFALILEDSRPNQQMWLEAFVNTPNLRCVIPKIYWGYTGELVNRIDLVRVDLIAIDWFIDSWELHEETQTFLNHLRTVNPHALVVETSVVRPRHGEKTYRGSNLSCCSFNLFMDQGLSVVRDSAEPTMMKKVFVLQQILVPALAEAHRLEDGENIVEYDLEKDFRMLLAGDGIMVILEELRLSNEELKERFAQLDFKQKRLFLHCGLNVIANVYMEKDEMFYSVALFRMKLLLGL